MIFPHDLLVYQLIEQQKKNDNKKSKLKKYILGHSWDILKMVLKFFIPSLNSML